MVISRCFDIRLKYQPLRFFNSKFHSSESIKYFLLVEAAKVSNRQLREIVTLLVDLKGDNRRMCSSKKSLSLTVTIEARVIKLTMVIQQGMIMPKADD